MPRKGGSRSGLSLKVTGDIVRRLASVRALWLAVYNDPDQSVQDLAVEFFHAVGQLLEGRPLEQMVFKKIDKDHVLEHVQEG